MEAVNTNFACVSLHDRESNLSLLFQQQILYPVDRWSAFGQMRLTVQFSVCDEGSSECDATNVGAKIRDKLDHVAHLVFAQMRILDHELGNTRHHGGKPDQAVEGGDKLR